MIIKKIHLGLIIGWIISLLLMAMPASGMVAGDLEDLKIITHFFTNRIANPRLTLQLKDPSKTRFLGLLVSVDLKKGDGKIFTNDFVLRYFHADGTEDRTQCEAIGIAKTPDMGTIEDIAIGANAAAIKLNKGKGYLALFFNIEPDVNTVELYRIGTTMPIIYNIGAKRPFSVYITTNTESYNLTEIKRVIEEGDYQVTAISRELSKDTTGVTIHYVKQAESQAREISQRLMTKFGIVPQLKAMELVSEFDIVIWLGK